MRRTIPILRGLAILGVIWNHANWHVLSLFAAGDAAGHPFVLLDQLGKFPIVAFLFIAGYFAAYAASGGKRDMRWSIVRVRLENLLWPWLLWSVILMVGHSFQDRPLSLVEFVRNLFIQYYFIPLLMFYYLLSPLVVKSARKNARSLLIGAALIQLLALALFYARAYLPGFPDRLNPWVDLGPLAYLRFAFYFPFGVVCGMFPAMVKAPLNRFKPILPWLVLFFFGLSFLEGVLAYNLGGEIWPIGNDQNKLSSVLYSMALVLCAVVYNRWRVPQSRTISNIGAHSYGLYLCHYVILGVMARVIVGVTPRLAAQGWLFLPMLFFSTVGLSMFLLYGVARLPTRRYYRYVFG